jgi:hypothetical protein
MINFLKQKKRMNIILNDLEKNSTRKIGFIVLIAMIFICLFFHIANIIWNF